VVPEVAGMWVEPIENPNIRAITGDSCMRMSRSGKMVARCLFNLKGSVLANSARSHHFECTG